MNLTLFQEQPFRIPTPTIQLRPDQKALKKEIYDQLRSGFKRVLVVAPCGYGKCLAKDTPIIMYDGSVKLSQNIAVGDILMGDDSKPRHVDSICRGRETMVKVIPNKGEPFTCNRSHILSLVYNGRSYPKSGWINGNIYDFSIDQYLSLPKHIQISMLLYRVPVEFDSKPVTIDPYFLGIWLGDGNHRNTGVCTSNPVLIDYIKKYADRLGMKVYSDARNDNPNSQLHRITTGEKGPGKNYLLNMIKDLSLIENKHIPRNYLINSREVRLELLAGLLDTDGHWQINGGYEIAQRRKELADQIVFLSRSLGFFASVGTKEVKGETYYRVRISGNTETIPIKTEYKKTPKEYIEKQKCNVLRTNFKLEFLKEDDYYGFTIDGNRRFLLGDFTVTHNTVLFCQMIYDAAIKKHRRTLIVVPFICLIDQTLDALEKFGLTAGVIAGNYREDRLQKVQIATTQTLARRDIFWFNPEVIFFDECHLSAYCQWFRDNFNNLKDGKQTTSIADISSELAILGIAIERESLEFGYRVTFEEVKQKYKSLTLLHHPDHGGSKEKMQELNSAWETIRKQKDLFSGKELSADNRMVIGLTATPWRLSKREKLGDIFEAQVTGPTPKEMIERKALLECVYFAIKDQINTKGVKTTGGDFDAAELETRCLEAVQSIVSEYKRLGQNRQFVCFAAGKVHADSLAKEFTNQGISVAVITAETPQEERKEIFKNVAELKTRGIININTCGIGFNLPEISCIIHSRPTKSMTLYIQMTGRGQRLCPQLNKTDCLVLDQAGNTKRHGFIEDVTYPDLRKASNTEKGEAPVKECENCGCMVHASARVCPECGFEFPSARTEKRIANEKLQLILPDEDKTLYYAYRQARREAYEKGKKPEWARYEIVRIYKLSQWWPKAFWKLYAVFGTNYTKDDVKSYWDYLNRCCGNPDWIEKCMKEEFGDDYSENIGK